MRFLALLLFVAFCSCTGLNRVSVSEVEINKLKSLSGSKATIEIKTRINNPSAHTLYIKDSEFDIYRKGYTFGKARLKEKVEIPAHTDEYHMVLYDIKITDAMSLMSGAVQDMVTGKNYDNLTFTGYIKAGTAVFSKKYRFNDTSIYQMNLE